MLRGRFEMPAPTQKAKGYLLLAWRVAVVVLLAYIALRGGS